VSGRIREVDGLRAVAVASVIAFHFLEKYFPGGFQGVDVFFVISGFVITGSLLVDRERLGSISLRRFYWKRVCRIMPALWVTVLVTGLAGLLLSRPQGPQALAALLSAMNWARAFDLVSLNGGALAHTWSLSIEEQFYLLWPLGLVLLLKAPRRAGLTVLATAVAFVLLWRFALVASGAGFHRIYDGLDTHADGLLIGCLIALWGRPPPAWVGRTWVVPVFLLGYFTLRFGTDAPANVAVSLTCRAVLSAWIVYAATGPATLLHPLLRTAPFQWGGSRSYSLYLWHYPVWFFFAPYEFFYPAKLLAQCLLTLAAAEASYRLVEQPVQRFGRRKLAEWGRRRDERRAGLLAPVDALEPLHPLA
jgi:peptidoglycan/LPS O-acetylase OafA/YrhL